MRSRPLGAILLTGGASSRMGRDKARIEIDGTSIAERCARLLDEVVDIAVEVGEGITHLPAVCEEPRHQGPLAAIVAGHRELLRLGIARNASCLVLAGDLPLLDSVVLEQIANPPGSGSVLPVIEGFPQPLLARWSRFDLDRARVVFDEGGRSLRGLPDRDHALILGEQHFAGHLLALSDVDTPEDLVRLKIGVDERTGRTRAQ